MPKQARDTFRPDRPNVTKFMTGTSTAGRLPAFDRLVLRPAVGQQRPFRALAPGTDRRLFDTDDAAVPHTGVGVRGASTEPRTDLPHELRSLLGQAPKAYAGRGRPNR